MEKLQRLEMTNERGKTTKKMKISNVN